jgi:hypothetical protein
VSDAGRGGDEAAGADRDALAFGSDLKRELALEHVEGLGVPVNVWACHVLAWCAARTGEAEVLACDEEADRHETGVSP